MGKKTAGIILSLILILTAGYFLTRQKPVIGKKAEKMATEKTVKKDVYVREPAVAGAFYDGNPEVLRKRIEGLIDKAKYVEVPGRLIGLMEPHAGYVYSGPVAAAGYKRLMGKKYETVIVLAPSHRVGYEGVSIIPEGIYRTPLGDVEIDSDLAAKIMKKDPQNIRFIRQAHSDEHSLEVQVPFLQVALQKGWKIVPIVYGQVDIKTSSLVAEALAPYYDPTEHLIIASSDLSHFYTYDQANSMDTPTMEKVENLEIEELYRDVMSRKSEMCGAGPVFTLMILTAALQGKAKLLDFGNSGDTAGDKSRVVGYGCAAFYFDGKLPEKTKADKEDEVEDPDKVQFSVNDEQKKMLLDMSRKTLTEYIKNKKVPDFDYKDPLLEKELGLFVTLRKDPGQQLRGCIGHVFPVAKLGSDIKNLTIAAATEDPRFPPVKENELARITIEVSLMSPMRKIKDWNEIKIPGHGVYVKKGFRSGVFLPQVADETGWNREEFMAHLCAGKAGLPQNAWKDPETELYVFTVVMFEEHEK